MTSPRENEEQYRLRIALIHDCLGINEEYELHCGLALQPECQSLSDAGLDVFGRPALLDAATLQGWKRMQHKALSAGVTLQLVSAWRSADYQKGIFQRKLDKGKSLKDILKVNAAPGFSEHHTGTAIDIGTQGFEHLTEAFDSSEAYGWLCEHAAGFGFSLSFPRDNPAGILYEPWHWKFSPRLL